ncbi:LOW QUALITY PROTEIN: disease resistance protein SUMM2-like [Punica granatum]|uniref:LOW QUALITY PROTEIN: disease resistance protein SUMM2-like n=1 Tax=Punica granatum TaxID=22663 RepID=A0A6P8C0I2_PUNGR|nr:LOW QUALITY PROTEIN: disease resistance protein SUMM2-like [Punica granatum]
MKRKSFLLFLDDVWDEINLLNIGIPYRGHQRQSKIIFTTRSGEVCGLMQAERTKKIGCLPRDKALELFREKVGEETWTAHVEIPRLAESLVKECSYLPLALITVGAAMAGKKHPDEWGRAIKYLENRPSDFTRMTERVLSVLEFSYDALPNETQKKCFLYCSIFPEDYVFDVDELIDLWMGEGFLSECECSHEARDWGIDIIRYLIRVCLLEVVDEGIGEDFKMHDVVRDMALWLVSEHGQKKNKIVCLEKQRSFEPKEFMKWTNAETIYLQLGYQKMENFAVNTPGFFQSIYSDNTRNQHEYISKDFFSSMPLLRVLDLSSNSDLEDLPNDIGALVNLTYLDLRWTSIIKLPVELKTLTKLGVSAFR